MTGRIWPPVSFDPPCAGDSPGEATVSNASARVSGRQNHLRLSPILSPEAWARGRPQCRRGGTVAVKNSPEQHTTDFRIIW